MPSSNDVILATPERISELSSQLQTRIQSALSEIERINLQPRLLAFNAQIEAARAGDSGRSFAIVSGEMVGIAERTQRATTSIRSDTSSLSDELAAISRELSTSVRGTRFADLAHTNIELIDRNLYERSCDCRWWATDAAVVSVLERQSPDILKATQGRLAVILKAYTVYFDIVVADLSGRIVANGRPDLYPSAGLDCAQTPWFASALATASGDEFGFQTVHPSPLSAGQRALVYSCKICKDGNAHNTPIGVLGVVFRWDALAQTIVRSTAIGDSDRQNIEVCIVDDSTRILASTDEDSIGKNLALADSHAVFAGTKNSLVSTVSGRSALIAHAASPGYETYRTGWHSLIYEFRRDNGEAAST